MTAAQAIALSKCLLARMKGNPLKALTTVHPFRCRYCELTYQEGSKRLSAWLRDSEQVAEDDEGRQHRNPWWRPDPDTLEFLSLPYTEQRARAWLEAGYTLNERGEPEAGYGSA